MKNYLQIIKRKAGMLCAALSLFSITQTQAQINVALTAVSAQSGGGQTATGYGPELYNNGVIPTYLSGNPYEWGWVNGNGWIEYTWTAAQMIDSVTFHNGGAATNRHFTALVLQYWNGTAYVNVGNVTGGTVPLIGYKFPNTITTTKLRFNSIAGANPSFREIQAWSVPVPNDAGVTAIVSPDTMICAGTYAVQANIKNFGINIIDSVQVNWSLNGINQVPVMLTTPLVVNGSPGLNDINVTLGNTNIVAPTSLKVWTSLPNGLIDSMPGNDTAILSLTPKVFTISTPSDTVCAGVSTLLSIAPTPSNTATSIEWWSGNGTFSLINGASNNTYNEPGLTSAQSFYSKFTQSGVTCFTDTVELAVITPQVLSVQDSGSCVPGSIVLSAIANSGSVLRWYNDQTTITPLHTGDTFVTPFLMQSKTYWVSAQIIGGVCNSPRVPVEASILSDGFNVNLGDDFIACVDSGSHVFLNAMNAGSTYLWDNAYNGQVRAIAESGQYWVIVTNSAGCALGDTINVVVRENPNLDLGPDIYVCEDVDVVLDTKDNGIQRIWNTGETNKQIIVNRAGVYTATVTGNNGCVVMDTVEVFMSGNLPIANNIRVRYLSHLVFGFSQIDTANTTSYRWDFGDGNYSYAARPTHTYMVEGNYNVTLNASSNCGYVLDSTTVHIQPTSINNNTIAGAKLNIYPNPSSNHVTISIENDVKIQSVYVSDIRGRVIMENVELNTGKTTIDVSALATGVYYLQVITDKGNANTKLEVLK